MFLAEAMAYPTQAMVFVTQRGTALNTVGIGSMLAWNPLAVAASAPNLLCGGFICCCKAAVKIATFQGLKSIET